MSWISALVKGTLEISLAPSTTRGLNDEVVIYHEGFSPDLGSASATVLYFQITEPQEICYF